MTSEITRLHKMGFQLREAGRKGCMAVSRDPPHGHAFQPQAAAAARPTIWLMRTIGRRRRLMGAAIWCQPLCGVAVVACC